MRNTQASDIVVPKIRADGTRWYAVQSQPRREAVALQHLGNQSFEAFCPMRRSLLRVRGKFKQRLTPFFPRYLFVRLDLERQRWRSVNGTVGVVGLVGGVANSEGRPTPLPTGLVERFQALSAKSGEMRFREALRAGDTVRVIGGPFDQLCGSLEAAGELERVTILLNLLSKQTRVQLPRDMLVAA